MTNQQRRANISYLRKLVLELHILHRYINSYPPEHPLVEQALDLAYTTISNLLSQSRRLIIGVTRNTLILGDDVLDAAEPAVRSFAGTLFAFGIISITFSEGLSIDELRRFNEHIIMKRQNASSPESVRALFDSLALEHVAIGALDYGAIKVRLGMLDAHDESTDFWELFVKGVIAEMLTHSTGKASETERYTISPPEMLADMLSESISMGKGTAVPALLKLLERFMQRIDESTVVRDKHSFEKFIKFLHALKPEVRHYFFESIVNAFSDRPLVAEAFFDGFSSGLLADLLNESLQKQGAAPPAIINLLQRLNNLRFIETIDSKDARRGKHGVFESSKVPADEALKQKLQVIFREEQPEMFVPEEYNATLSSLLSTRTLSKSEEQDILLLRKTLDNHEIEVKMSGILLELIDTNLNADGHNEQLEQSLLDLCSYFVRMGDFAALAAIYERTQQIKHTGEQQIELRKAFLQSDFIEEILQAPAVWGKQKFDEIAALIHRVGEPFVDPILDRLAEEDNRSLRRFYVSSLSGLGDIVIAKTAARLTDFRWYFVRNLVVILSNTKNPAILPFIRTLINHPHPKVRQNVEKTLLQFHDPDALVMLLSDLSSSDFEVRMGAINLVEKYHIPDIIRKLAEIVETGGFSSEELELKMVAVRTLSRIGDAACLPSFERVLKSRSFFRKGALNQLKDEIVTSLSRFSSPFALDLLHRVSASGSNELARKAKKIAEDMEKGHEL